MVGYSGSGLFMYVLFVVFGFSLRFVSDLSLIYIVEIIYLAGCPFVGGFVVIPRSLI